jgi:hypothetical protein
MNQKVGRVTPCAPPPANRRVRVRRNRRARSDAPYQSPSGIPRVARVAAHRAGTRHVAHAGMDRRKRGAGSGTFSQSRFAANFAERLAAKAHHLYPRHKHFHKGLNRPGWRGRENLLMFMRHWTAGWLKRERYAFYKKLPWSFANGQRLPDDVRASFRQGYQAV